MVSSPPGRGGSARPVVAQRRKYVRYEARIALWSFLVAAPGLVASAVLMWLLPWSLQSRLIVFLLVALAWWLLALTLREEATRPLQTLSNVVASLREQDYSFRARRAAPGDALGDLSFEVNTLADLLSEHRTGAIEATALVRRVVEEIDVPLFAFDPSQRLWLVNPAGERLLQQPAAAIQGENASALGLQACLSCESGGLMTLRLGGSERRWLIRRSSFRQKGVPHTLIVLSDVSRALKEEERKAWQRLIRVLGHELNNSLTPIKSIAGSLGGRIAQLEISDQERGDFQKGLEIIETRAGSLNRFLQAYRQLAQMPAPVLRECALRAIVKRVADLETRVAVHTTGGPDTVLTADPDQIEQMLINLVRNAAEAALEWPRPSGDNGQHASTREEEPKVDIRWETTDKDVVIAIEDNGPGLSNPHNMFVPFYTTKSSGSGIGLVLSRQIAEAHAGSIELSNRSTGHGCVVRIVLPGMLTGRDPSPPAAHPRIRTRPAAT